MLFSLINAIAVQKKKKKITDATEGDASFETSRQEQKFCMAGLSNSDTMKPKSQTQLSCSSILQRFPRKLH